MCGRECAVVGELGDLVGGGGRRPCRRMFGQALGLVTLSQLMGRQTEHIKEPDQQTEHVYEPEPKALGQQ